MELPPWESPSVSSSTLDSLSAAQPKAKRATLEALEARKDNSDLRLIYLLRREGTLLLQR